MQEYGKLSTGIAMIMLRNVSYWWEDGEIALNNINLES